MSIHPVFHTHQAVARHVAPANLRPAHRRLLLYYQGELWVIPAPMRRTGAGAAASANSASAAIALGSFFFFSLSFFAKNASSSVIPQLSATCAQRHDRQHAAPHFANYSAAATKS